MTILIIIGSLALLLGIMTVMIAIRFFRNQAQTYRLFGNQIANEREPAPYENLETARREIFRENLGIMAVYGVYFLVAVPGIIYYFKGVQYGPNLPYTLFLLAMGIPFLACFIHVVWKAELQRARLFAAGVTDTTAGSFVLIFMKR